MRKGSGPRSDAGPWRTGGTRPAQGVRAGVAVGLRSPAVSRSGSHEGPLGRVPSPALVVGAMASIQFGAALAATLFSKVGPAGTVLLRLVSASLMLLAIVRPPLRGHTRSQLRLAVMFGLVIACMNLAFYAAVDRVPLGVVVAVEFLGPLGVAVAGSRRPIDLLWVVLAAAGVLALSRPGGNSVDLLGLAFALAAGACWALYILLSARTGARFEGASGLTLAMCVAALLVVPVGAADGGSELLQPEVLAVGAAVGGLASAIPYTLELEALRRIRPHVFGVLMSLEPAIAALAGLLVLGQHLDALELVGILLVTLASLGASRAAMATAVAQ